MKYDITAVELKKLIQYVEYNHRRFDNSQKIISALKQAIKEIKKGRG